MTPQDPWRPWGLLGCAERLCEDCAQHGPTNAEGLCDTCYEISGLKAEVGRLEKAVCQTCGGGEYVDLRNGLGGEMHQKRCSQLMERARIRAERDTARTDLAEAVALLRDVYMEQEGEWLYAGGGETYWLAKRDAFLARHAETKGAPK